MTRGRRPRADGPVEFVEPDGSAFPGSSAPAPTAKVRWSRRRWVLLTGVIVVIGSATVIVAPWSAGSHTTSTPTTVATSSVNTATTGPSRWTVTAIAWVSSADGAVPFDLRAESPVVSSDLEAPTTLVLRATVASDPVLATFGPEVFTTRLRGAGTLDVIGPTCPQNETFPAGTPQPCGADPAVLPIGATYNDIPGPKNTGPIVPSEAIRLTLDLHAVRADTYRLVEIGNWRLASETGTRPLTVTIDFTVTAS